MKLLLYTAVLWLSAIGFAFSQSNHLALNETIFYAKNGNPDWLVIRPGIQISTADFLRQHKLDLGLTAADELILYRSDVDDIGFTHNRYNQYHRGVKVDGAELLIHEKNGFVRTLNGKLVRGLQLEIRPQLSANAALTQALKYVNAEVYMWEVDYAEALLKRIKDDPTATFFPKPELVLVAPGFTHSPADFQAAWHLEVYAEQPSVRKEIFVSVKDGSILEEVNMLHDQNTPGTAETRYSGTREIITDSIDATTYRLVETTRGNGVETYNMQEGTNHGAAVDFIDDDNNWNNTNAAQDEVATDAHWGAEMTYDYFLNKHNHASVDGNNMPLIGFVHYDNNWCNAQWTGEWARYGDCNGNSWGPLISIDIVAHEYTHGVTGFSANLRYRNESGALNESFSDVFGAAVEFFADPTHADWLMGEDITVNSGSPLRNMKNPNQYGDPDTYEGDDWATGTGDNGGVHTNSGVQNYWFYLLTEGGSGTNDNNKDFAVKGLGIDTSGAIAFRNLQYYLFRLAEYSDAREGALQAAEDLYGPCSEAYQETLNAWYAVGVGEKLAAYDLKTLKILDPAPLSCGLSDAEPISIQFRYDGCNTDLVAGNKIPLAYQIENHPVVWDTFDVASVLTGGDTVNFTFSVPASEFAVPGTYHLRCWTGLDTDLNLTNNELSIIVESILDQEGDVRMQKVESPVSNCFLGFEAPEVEVGYWGCDELVAGTTINLYYSINGEAPVIEQVQVPETLQTGDAFSYQFSEASNFILDGEYTLDVWVNYGQDVLAANDTLFDLRIKNPVSMYRNEVVTFEFGDTSLDSIFTLAGSGTTGAISAAAARTGAFGYQVAGGDIDLAFLFDEAEIPKNTNVWDVNDQFRSKLCICANLSGMEAAELRFDAKQNFSLYYLNKFGFNAPYGSTLRVLIDGEQISPNYKPITHSFDSWKARKFDLEDYLGGTVEICFETHTGIDPALDTFITHGDRVFLDNIAIVSPELISTSDLAVEPEWHVMPNPGTGLFSVSLFASETQDIVLEVFDALGQTVRTQHVSVSAGDNQIPLDLMGSAAGMYVVRLGLGQQQYVRRLVLQD